ncbi:hypothetical protein Vretimale_7349 [Volvox reticuliferus]|uniref:Glycosyltransferase family 92 protein n=1 Tax=Volvox reticuliferus TaxID=1737510 RepID=A0A8J4G9G0_9CHLO|nr:hypothetical protein Vretifemale_7464 [Volvox reticuliferus]GIM02533.1 hypothetical protein Vretimale_7349 [Volvox reticuliferus]
MTTQPRRRGITRRSVQLTQLSNTALLAFPLLVLCGLPLPLGNMGLATAQTLPEATAGTLLPSSSAADGIVGTQGVLSNGSDTAAAIGSDGYSALCVVGRNENPYIREWVEYHRCLGFSRVYLYDHNSTVPLLGEIEDLVDSGFVVYTNYSAMHTKFKDGYTSDLDRFMSTVQGQAYKDCVDRFGRRHVFLGFIDIDEFLVIYDEKIKNVDDLLREYEQHPGLSIYWVLLGSSGHKDRPTGLVVDEYKACTPHNHKFNTQFKTFANTRFRPVMYSPHRAVFAAPPDPVTGLEPYMVDENHNRVPRGRNKDCTHTRAAVYHYVTKSLTDFNEKMHRGGGAGVTRPTYYFDLMDKYSKETCEGAVQTRQRFCGGRLPHVLSVVVAGTGSDASNKEQQSAEGSVVKDSGERRSVLQMPAGIVASDSKI